MTSDREEVDKYIRTGSIEGNQQLKNELGEIV
jgi:hypothetical protein